MKPRILACAGLLLAGCSTGSNPRGATVMTPLMSPLEFEMLNGRVNRGDPDAALTLARHCRDGVDPGAAVFWYQKAIALGSSPARVELREFKNSINELSE